MRVPCSTCSQPEVPCHSCDSCEERRVACPDKKVPCATCVARGVACRRTPRMVRVRRDQLKPGSGTAPARAFASEQRRKRLKLAATFSAVVEMNTTAAARTPAPAPPEVFADDLVCQEILSESSYHDEGTDSRGWAAIDSCFEKLDSLPLDLEGIFAAQGM